MRLITILTLLSTVSLVACAKRPDAIVPVDIPMAAYSGMNCKALASETIKENEKLAALSKEQNKAASNDAFGVFLIGVPLGSATGGDKEGHIAVSKGKLQSLENVGRKMGCK